MFIPEGFANQRMVVVPPPVVSAALSEPITRRLVVTAAGYFPDAFDHARIRDDGIEEHIVILCVAGAGRATIGSQSVRIGPGSALIVPARTPHRYGSSHDESWTIWWCHVRGSDAAELVANIVSQHGVVTSLRDPDRVVPLAQNIVSELERDVAPQRLVHVAGLAWNLLTQIGTNRVLRDRGEPVERAIAYLGDAFSEPIKVSELAALVGVSTSHLSALFKRATGGGVLAYQTGLRMRRAQQLLDMTSLTVREVAFEVGYGDPLYFSRHFRKHQGQSPRQYRERPKGTSAAVG